jgi:hypothetical protein
MQRYNRMKKFIAEGKLEETKTVLGWIINTRNLTISLPPDDKHIKWITDINSLIGKHQVHHKHLCTSIGRLEHIANIIPILRHFLVRICHALARALKHNWTCLTLHKKSDLHLLMKFIDRSTQSISINNLVFLKPTIIYRSDASEFGIGGYNIAEGTGWRFEIPVNLHLRTSINSLEFIACLITIWIDTIHKKINPESGILSQTDSTSATGWLHKTNFADNDDEIIQMSTVRQLAYIHYVR